MKHLLFTALLTLTANAFATDPVCELKANNWLKSANLTIISYDTKLTFEDCLSKGQDLFNSEVKDGLSIINPLKNQITYKSWTTQYKKVKITYRMNGEKLVEKLERDVVKKSPVTVKVVKVKSGFKCWTQGDCEPLNEE